MRAVVQRCHGGPEALVLETVPVPRLAPHEVSVAVEAAGLNRLDLLQRQRPVLKGFQLPHIAGMDVTGVIVEAGSEVDARRIGERVVIDPNVPALPGSGRTRTVIGGNVPGGFSEVCVVPASNVYVLPEHISPEVAAAFPTVYSTAWRSVLSVAGLRSGQWMLVHGSSSTLTMAVVQIAGMIGARTVVAGRDADHLTRMKSLGADAVVDSTEEDVVQAVSNVTGGRGVDVVVDHVGGATFATSVRAVARGGRVVVAGNVSGDGARIGSLSELHHKGIHIIGCGSYRPEDFKLALDALTTGLLVPVIADVGGLECVVPFQERLLRGEPFGKLVVVP
ncbi:zinc-binding alcohol dehydrogenase family protein [Streptomyces collinus]|uniref:quinone oxidoreductase family protein n=1 Tax=Streptomyces collinus TaxID=42684 RepID=UPI00369A2E57